MASSLSNLVNNLSERIDKIKCKYGHDDKKMLNLSNYIQSMRLFSWTNKLKDDLIEYICLSSNKNYKQTFHEKLKGQFFNTFNFLTMITISLFYCCEKVFILMNIWMIGKSSVKHDYLKKKIFIVT